MRETDLAGIFHVTHDREPGPALRELHEEFGDRVRFVTVYVREAHPGERYPQPEERDRKLRHARDYRERYHIDLRPDGEDRRPVPSPSPRARSVAAAAVLGGGLGAAIGTVAYAWRRR